MARKRVDKIIKLEECSEGKLWTVPEMADFSGLSVPTITRMMENGELKWVSIGPYGKRSRRIPHREVLRICAIDSANEKSAG
jgi:excisionase family DNA binding protein